MKINQVTVINKRFQNKYLAKLTSIFVVIDPICSADSLVWDGPEETIGEIVCPPSPVDNGYPIGHVCAYECPSSKPLIIYSV